MAQLLRRAPVRSALRLQSRLAALPASGGCTERPTRRGTPPRRSRAVSARTRAKGTNARSAGICQHQRRMSACKECGGGGICQHQRIRSQCKECGGAGICPHQCRMSACKECGQEADESMPARLEELGEGVDGAGVDGQRTPQMTRGGDASRVLCPCVEGKQGLHSA